MAAQSFAVNVTNTSTTNTNGNVTKALDGTVTFHDSTKGVDLASTKITAITVSNDGTHATITGNAKVGKTAVTFTVSLVISVTGAVTTETFDLTYVGGGKSYDSGVAVVDPAAFLIVTTNTTKKSVPGSVQSQFAQN